MAKLTLYHAAPSRSSVTLWMLEELGEPYDIHLLSLTKGENREPAYLAVNPMGKVPALVHDGKVVTEGAAICAYLALTFPEAGLMAEDKALAETIEEIHKTVGNIGYFLIGLHTVAALYHHYFMRDNTLRRILPGQ